MPATIFQIERGKFGLSLTDPGVSDACAATVGDYTDFSCQVTSGALTASANIGQNTVPATFCDPEQNIPNVGATDYSLDLTFLQDPNVVAGLSRFLFEHDTAEVWWFFGMDGDDPPKAIGTARLTAGTLGGDARSNLTATVSLAVVGKPEVCFGDATSSAVVGGNDLSSQYAGAAALADLATLKADATYGDTGTAAPYNGGTGTEPAFSSGTYITLADASTAHWTGSAWAAGAAT